MHKHVTPCVLNLLIPAVLNVLTLRVLKVLALYTESSEQQYLPMLFSKTGVCHPVSKNPVAEHRDLACQPPRLCCIPDAPESASVPRFVPTPGLSADTDSRT